MRSTSTGSSTGTPTPTHAPTTIGNPLADPLMGHSALDGSDPLSQFAREELDPLSRMAADEVSTEGRIEFVMAGYLVVRKFSETPKL